MIQPCWRLQPHKNIDKVVECGILTKVKDFFLNLDFLAFDFVQVFGDYSNNVI